MDQRPLLIVGASARAAAASARRAGYSPIALDRFADRDLFQIARVLEIPPGGQRIDAVSSLPPCDWMYTGGMENEPDLVDAISQHHRLLGNPGRVLRRIRDPLAWTSALRSAGLPCLDVATAGMGSDRRKSWICKPLRSIGGLGVRLHDGGTIPEGHYLQERAEGRLVGAQFRVLTERTQFLGACEQWVGGPGSPGPFAYRSSLGPLTLNAAIESQLQTTAEVLADSFGLSGLFGIDAILTPDGTAWPIEINPRYTAAVEVLERVAWGAPAITFTESEVYGRYARPESSPAMVGSASLMAGKCILYAERAFTWREMDIPEDVADIPREGAIFRPGDPILTVLAEGPDLETVSNRLHTRIEGWRRRLEFSS